MTKRAKIVIAILTFVVFAGVGYFDAERRALSLQHRADVYELLCQDRADPVNRSDEQCISEHRRALDQSQGKAIVGALPIAIGAAAIFLALCLIFMRLRSSKRGARAAD
jgi:hypothetical protein